MTTMALAAPRFLRSTIGKKVVMAVTGVILFGFVIGHMLGNLQVYLGPDKLNAYAAFLKHTPSLLWGTRIVLLIAVIAHIVVAVQLNRLNERARPVPYATRSWRQASYAARTMMMSGPILGLFIIYHLLHFTTGTVHPSFSETDVYANFVSGFQQAPAAVAYLVAMAALGLHLWHGAFSLFQSVGLRNPRWSPIIRRFAVGATLVVTLANMSFPIAVQLGFVK